MDQRKSRKKDLIAHKRELYSYKTPVESSVSPMFGGGNEASLVNGKADEEEKASLHISQTEPHGKSSGELHGKSSGELRGKTI